MKNGTIKWITVALIGLLVQGATAAPMSVLLEQGIYTEETVGDRAGAIEIYQQIIADAAANRKIVAEALFRLGRCFAAEGDAAAALEVLQRLVKDYSRNESLVQQAQVLIDELAPQTEASGTGRRSDRIAVEDLSLQLLAAIRDQDDAALRKLSTDRIDGWRDALPVFAGEMRERFRQMTGKAFDMQAGESLVEGDYAVVQCTGSESLKGIYLVLSFERGAGGWKNIAVRNSPPGKTLQSHLSELLKTAADSGWDKDPLHLLPAPWKTGDVLRYRLLTKTGTELGTMIWSVQSATHDGHDCWRIGQRMAVPASDVVMASSVVADQKTFLPYTGRAHHALGTVEAVYTPGRVKLFYVGSTREMEVPDTVFDNEQALFLIRRLPLEEGYSATFPILSLLSGASGMECRIRVMKRETVKMAGRKALDCWKILIQVYLGEIKAVEQTAWFSVNGHVPVRLETDQVDIELVEQHNLSNGNTAFMLKKSGVTLNLPENWFAYEWPSGGKNSEIVRLLPPDMQPTAMLCKAARDPASCSVRDIAESDIETLKGIFKNYTVREDSIQETTVNEMPAAIYTADYQDQGGNKVEYRAYCTTGNTVYWFVFRMDADKFDAYRSELDQLIAGLRAEG